MPAYCAAPDIVTLASRDPAPGTLVLTAPSATSEICDTSVTTTTTTNGSTPISTTVETGGPPGPPGPIVPHEGIKWAGNWATGTMYFAQDINIPRHADTVRMDDTNSYYVCIKDHTSDDINKPQLSTFDGPTEWTDNWELVVNGGITSKAPGSFLDNLFDGVFDWMKEATIGDWLGALAIGTGIIMAGTVIADMMSTDGSTDESSKYNGTPSHVGDYTPPSLRQVVESLCIEAGIASYNVSALSDTIRVSFTLAQSTTARNVLDNLSKAFMFDMVDSNGTLKFVPRTNTTVRTLTHDDMGFNDIGESVAPVTMKRLQSSDLPRSVSLTYIAEDIDYNNFTQRSEIPTFAEGNDVTLSVPFMLKHDDAKEAVDKMLIGAHLERMSYTFKSSYINAIDLEPGDVVSIPEGDVRINQIEETEEGILQINAVDAGFNTTPQPIMDGGTVVGYTASTYLGTGLGTQTPAPVLNAPSEITKSGMLFLDIPVIDSVDTIPRAYVAVHGYGIEGWTGAQLFKSVDGGAKYDLIGTQSSSATLGMVSSPVTNSDYYNWDDSTVITVVLKAGTLISKTNTAVLAGENTCMIGNECIAFGVATLVGPSTYNISHLLRGRRGTEFATGTHVPNELFVMLDSSLMKIEVPESDRGKTYKYKIVTVGSDLTKSEPQDLQVIGSNTLPWAPVQVNKVHAGTTWTVTWKERARFNGGLQDYNDIVRDSDWAGWAVAVFNWSTVVRQEIVYVPEFVYPIDKQTADFGSGQSSLKVSIQQISLKYGGGRPVIST